MVFLAQGESPTSCAGELGRNPAAPMLQHIVQKNILLITGSASEAGPGFRAGAGIGSRIPLTGGHQIRADASYTPRLPLDYSVKVDVDIFSDLLGESSADRAFWQMPSTGSLIGHICDLVISLERKTFAMRSN